MPQETRYLFTDRVGAHGLFPAYAYNISSGFKKSIEIFTYHGFTQCPFGAQKNKIIKIT